MKCVRSIAVLCIVSILLVVPSFAWDSNSFVGQDFYFYDPVISKVSAPALMAAGDTSSQTSVSGPDFLSLLSVSSQYVAPILRVHKDSYSIAGVTVPSYTGPMTGSWSPIVSRDSSSTYISYGAYTSYDFSEYDSILGAYGPIVSFSPDGSSSPLVYDFDIDSFGSFTTFELDGLSRLYTYLYDGSRVGRYLYNSVSLYVNDALVHTFYPDSSGLFDFSSFFYNSSSPITSIQFKFYWGLSSESWDLPFSGNIYCLFWWVSGSVPPSFTVLTDDGILSGQYDQTQDDINEVDGLESQWGNSMTENFNALSLDTFTYPDGLTSGFALISGIFQDLWNAMGSYSILYVLPLTLAVVLLLIGRISKFAGQGRASPSKEE